MSKIVKTGLVVFIKTSDKTIKGTYKVEIVEEFDEFYSITPLEHLKGSDIEVIGTGNYLAKKEDVSNIKEKEVSRWNYFWGNY